MKTEPARLLLAGLVAIVELALPGCGGARGDETTEASRAAIIGGLNMEGPGSPVLYLLSPEGGCTAVLVAPTLVVTARHCVAQSRPGTFSCTATGDLILNGNGAGQIGADDSPGSLNFFTNTRAATGAAMTGRPDAVGLRIVSTQTSTSCRDDLAFVVLNQAIPGLVPIAIRLNTPTRAGETVSIWGYGLTDQLAPTALRARQDVQILGVGPDAASTVTQPAPVRTVRTSPVTCEGDSGGPILSQTGALIAVVSLGSQAGASGPFCSSSRLSDTIGPRLAGYRDLALLAFQAAGASPLEEGPPRDAAAPQEDSALPPDSAGQEDSAMVTDSASTLDGVSEKDAASAPDLALQGPGSPMPFGYRATGGTCAAAPAQDDGAGALVTLVTLAIAWTAQAARRRRRWSEVA